MNIAEITRLFRPKMEQYIALNSFQSKLLDDISICKTPGLGGHIMACKDCGCIKATYNSCNNRHCPSCGSYKRDKWVLMRKSEALPVKYFHVVFTIPHQFNTMCIQAPDIMYELLFNAAWETIKQFSEDHKYLGAKTGMIAVLHTWGQNISLHPHIHCLIPSGGITQQDKWRQMKKSNGKFLFPVKAMSKVFKAKFCGYVSKHIKNKILKAPVNETNPYMWLNKLHQLKWVVYAKKPILKGASVVDYIGRYTHKVAISNSRIKNVKDGKVTFSWLDYKTSKIKEMQLEGDEFIRRFLLHILPKRFMKVRHYGFMANRNKAKAIENILKDLGAKAVNNIKGLS